MAKIKAKAPKVNMDALTDAVLRFNKDYRVEYWNTNSIRIHTYHCEISVDDIIGLSFRLYGTHNKLTPEVHGLCNLCLSGATYRLQPEFLVEGEQVEFEVNDYRHEE